MKIFLNPEPAQWGKLCERAAAQENADIETRVGEIISRIAGGGDAALRDVCREIDGGSPESFRLDSAAIDEGCARVDSKLKKAIENAAANIRRFHEAQLPSPVKVETAPGVVCLQKAVPISRVGLYIPGGTAPLFSTVLMLAIPASVAGCGSVALCTPAGKDGKVNPEVIYAATLCGIDEIYAVGGAQAIAAMAYGTQSIQKVDKIFGPGNRYVTAAKRYVSSRVCSIDMPAGPSEVMVLADASAKASFAAADLLSQMEHGRDSQALLVCLDASFADAVSAEVDRQAALLSRGQYIAPSLENSRIVVLGSRLEMIAFANTYAPEHLILALDDPWEAAGKITAAGSVFIGNYSCESAGDYASGTNHTLPTSGWARSCSGVNIDSYMRKITFQELSREGLSALSSTICEMACGEGLDAHANAVKVRLDE